MVVALTGALTGACGLGAKDGMADRIIESVDRAGDAGTAVGTLGVSSRVVKVPAAIAALAEGSGASAPELPPASAEVTFPVEVDLDQARAALLHDEARFEVFDDLDLYGLRQHVSKDEARPWARVSLRELDGEAEIDAQQDALIVAANAINPAVLIDLIAGVLTGSIDERGAETVGGVTTTRFDGNFDLDKTTRDTRRKKYEETRREAIEKLFDILKVKGRVNHGSVWVDDEGLPRQLVLRLRTEPEIDTIVDVSIRLTLERFGVPVSVEPPSSREWLEVSSVVGYLRTITPEWMLLSAFSGAGGAAPTGATTTTMVVAP